MVAIYYSNHIQSLNDCYNLEVIISVIWKGSSLLVERAKFGNHYISEYRVSIPLILASHQTLQVDYQRLTNVIL